MLRSLLLVLEGQDPGHGSIELALRWALQHDALLAGLGVIDESAVHPCEPVPLGAGGMKRELDAARLHQQQAAVDRQLSALAVRCSEVQAAFKPLECVGRPDDEIALEAQRFDLVVMPRRLERPGDACSWRVSDALQTMLRTGPRPVVAAADRASSGESVVVAYDGSLVAARTLFAWVSLGLARARPVHVLTIGDTQRDAARRGNRAVAFLDAHGIHAALHAVANEAPAESLMRFACEVDAGMIVLGSHGKSRVREFFLGSVTTRMLARCSTPLFLFH